MIDDASGVTITDARYITEWFWPTPLMRLRIEAEQNVATYRQRKYAVKMLLTYCTQKRKCQIVPSSSFRPPQR